MMRLQSMILLALLLVTSGLIVGARIAASASPATKQATQPVTPLLVMPTPAATVVAGSDWLTYTSPFWGLTFRYPPDWQISGTEIDYLRVLDQETAQQSQTRMLGVPLMLSPGNENMGALTIIL